MTAIHANISEASDSFANSPVEPASPKPNGQTASTDAGRQFVAATVAEFGPTVRLSKSGKTELNLASLGRIVAYRLGLAYNQSTREFMQLSPDQACYTPVAIESVFHQTAVMLQKLAALHPNILGEVRPHKIAKLVTAMKLGAKQVRPDAHHGLLDYVRDRLCLGSGHNLTVEQIHSDYLTYARRRNLAMHGRIKFHKEIARTVQAQFTIPRVNNVMRVVQGTTRLTARRGFNGLKFKADGTDGTDGTSSSEAATNPS